MATTTTTAPIHIQRGPKAPHVFLSSPPSRPVSPGPPPPSPASVSRVAAPPPRRAVFDLRSSSPLSPSAGDKTLLRAQLERAKQNRVLLRSGKKARPLSQRELRRLAAEENGESSPAGTADGETTGSLTPLSRSDSDRASTVGLIGCIEGILSAEDTPEPTPQQQASTQRFPVDSDTVTTPIATIRPDSAACSDNVASAEQSPSNSPPRSTSATRPRLSHRISRTAPTTPSISPTSHISTLLSRRPSVKVDLSTAFATGLVVTASGSGSTASARQALDKTRSLPQTAAVSATISLPGSRRSSVPSSPLLTALKLPLSRPPSLPSPNASTPRRRHLSAGGSLSSAISPVSPPKQSVMSSDPRDLTLQFTRRSRPEMGPRTLSTSSVSSLLFARRASQPDLEEDCDTTEPDGSEPDEADTTRTGPFFEPSVFASPPMHTSATSYKSTGPSRAGSTSYWSIHSSASSQHTRAATTSSIASTQSRASEAGSPGHRRPEQALSKSRSPAKAVLQPSGLVQAMPLSPGVPLEAAWLPGPLPAQPSQLSLAHPARMVQQREQQEEQERPAASSRGAASTTRKAPTGVDLQRFRREQLARRRAVEADDPNESSSETAPADDEAEVVAAKELPTMERESPTTRQQRGASSWEDEQPAAGSSSRVAEGGSKPGGPRSPLLMRRTSAKRGGARL